MKYLKIFEEFNNEFPDVFNGTLIRGVKVDKDEYIDDTQTCTNIRTNRFLL